MLKLIFRSVKWIFFERVIQVAFALVLSAVLARKLGVKNFGALQAALSTISIFSAAGLMCGAELVMPLYGENKIANRDIFGKTFAVRFFLQCAAMVACATYVWQMVSSELWLLYVSLMVLILVVEPANAFAMYFQCQGEQVLVSKIRMSGVAIKFAILVSIALAIPNLSILGYGYAAEAIFVGAVFGFFYRSRGLVLYRFPDWAFAKIIFTKGVLFGVGIFSMVFFQKIDRIALSYIENKELLGVYSAAMQVAENWFYLINIVIPAIAGKFVYEKMDPEANSNIRRIAIAAVIVAFFAALISLALSDYIVVMLFGAAYAGSSYYLNWMFFISILVFLDASLSMKIIMNRDAYVFTGKWLLVACVASVYSYFGVNHWFEYNPLIGLGLGYVIAAIVSLAYFMIVKNEKNSVHM